MEISVEIDDPQLEKEIRSELYLIEEVIVRQTFDVTFVLPVNFDKKIQELLADDSYNSIRYGHEVGGKTLSVNKKSLIVLNISSLFSEEQDIQTRVSFYLHELSHVIFSCHFPLFNPKTDFDKLCMCYLKDFFEDYLANLNSFYLSDLIFPEKSNVYATWVNKKFNSFLSLLLDEHHLKELKKGIISQKIHGNSKQAFRIISDAFVSVTRCFIYLYSYMDYLPGFKEAESVIQKSEFYNQKTQAFVDYCRSKCQKGDFNLFDGLQIFKDYMTNFEITHLADQ